MNMYESEFATLGIEKLPWTNPHISIEGKGAISFEWWRQEKVLTIFVDDNGAISFLKAWGPNIWKDMEEGEDPSNVELIKLWQWLQQ